MGGPQQQPDRIDREEKEEEEEAPWAVVSEFSRLVLNKEAILRSAVIFQTKHAFTKMSSPAPIPRVAVIV